MISAAEASQARPSLHVATSASSMPLKIMDSSRRSPYVTPSPKWARRPGRTSFSACGLKGTSRTATKRSLTRLLCGGPAGFPLCPGLKRVFLPTSTMSEFMPVPCLTTAASQIIAQHANENIKPVGMPLCRLVGKWSVGGPNGSADKTDGASAALPLPRAPGRVARVHQENASHAG